ncbi:MAG TPA: zinc-dependent metalloprotease, partial [Burkholderiaceae bacterium]|nr:zinc-dependent metalloprotease [Burkholderiaceae bacterium]
VPPGTPQPGAAPPGSPQPYATVIKDAKKTEGLFTLYQKDEKVWIELKPGDFDKPFFMSAKIATGIGEAGLFGGLMDDQHIVEFRRIHNQVQMIARNTEFTARAGTPEGRAVAAAFSPSLLASTPVASQPEPGSKAVLVDANALFVNDMLGVGMNLQRTYRQGYAFDARNSAITALRARPQVVSLQVMQHFATGSIAVRQPGTPPGAPVPTVPRTVPDARSLFVTAHYSLAALPAEPMPAREADSRVGYFTSSQWDFSDDLNRTPVVRHVDRWRLEKKDPAAALSEPVKPIVFFLDRTIPLKYRDTISAGILEWNKAFEKIGFKDAIQVKIQPDDGDFDTLESGASVRWMTNAAPVFGAIGPSHVDPRSGEILAANIGIESLSSRNVRSARSQVLGSSAAEFARMMQFGGAASGDGFDLRACAQADYAADQMGYALDVLAARGELDPDSPEADQFVQAYLRDTTMHEVGHTLGLRHNFRASRAFTDAQLSDPEFTRTHALTGSVMEYAPINLAAPGAPRVAPYQTTLGPYDYWAIEYAYRPLAAADEKAALERIAARSNEPELAYGTDEDNFLGIDPDALQFDLGNDPLAFAKKRLAIARDLFKRQESRPLPPERDYAVLRRSLNYAVNDVARSTGVLARQIGGVRTLRDHPGSGRDPLQPVPAAEQREALDQIARGLFAADSLPVSAALQRRLAPDFQERLDAIRGGGAPGLVVATDYSVPERVLDLQRALLTQLLSDEVAARILDSQGKVAVRSNAFQLTELYDRLGRDIWSEIDSSGSALDIPAPRRALQREHLNRLTGLLLRPGGAGRADARSLVRAQATALLARLNAANQRGGASADTRAHLQDSADALAQVLAARVARPGA